jgi:transposase
MGLQKSRFGYFDRMGRPILQIRLNDIERQELERRTKAATTAKRDCLRAKIILARADGLKQEAVATRLGVSQVIVSKWTRRFMKGGMDGLGDAAGRGRKPSLPALKIRKVIEEVTQPPRGRTRWSVRSMARAAGISRHSVHQIWRKNDLKPHLSRTFKLSTDPCFEAKFWDVIGLYLNPPEKALVLCCDEKSQCQALERSQPGLPMSAGYVRTRTHDYIRHGTVTLFAALNYLEGKIISRTESRHTHIEWLRFLKQIDRQTPKDLEIHLIVDNYCTHKHSAVKAWLARHPRFKTHFTPTGGSWMNMVERFFGDLTADCVRDGSFTSIRDLITSIEAYLAERNLAPKPYHWRADGAEILRKIQRARDALSRVAETA